MPGMEKQIDEAKNLLESPGSKEGACEWPLAPSGHQSGRLALSHHGRRATLDVHQPLVFTQQKDCKLWSEELTRQLGNATCPA